MQFANIIYSLIQLSYHRDMRTQSILVVSLVEVLKQYILPLEEQVQFLWLINQLPSPLYKFEYPNIKKTEIYQLMVYYKRQKASYMQSKECATTFCPHTALYVTTLLNSFHIHTRTFQRHENEERISMSLSHVQ